MQTWFNSLLITFSVLGLVGCAGDGESTGQLKDKAAVDKEAEDDKTEKGLDLSPKDFTRSKAVIKLDLNYYLSLESIAYCQPIVIDETSKPVCHFYEATKMEEPNGKVRYIERSFIDYTDAQKARDSFVSNFKNDSFEDDVSKPDLWVALGVNRGNTEVTKDVQPVDLIVGMYAEMLSFQKLLKKRCVTTKISHKLATMSTNDMGLGVALTNAFALDRLSKKFVTTIEFEDKGRDPPAITFVGTEIYDKPVEATTDVLHFSNISLYSAVQYKKQSYMNKLDYFNNLCDAFYEEAVPGFPDPDLFAGRFMPPYDKDLDRDASQSIDEYALEKLEDPLAFDGGRYPLGFFLRNHL